MAASDDPATSDPIREVVLYTRADCSLCEKAEEALIALREPLGFELEARDVDQDAVLVERYGDRVPVVVCGGRELAEGAIDARRLRAALEAALATR